MKEELKKAAGERIRAARKVKGISQERLGEKLGVSFQAVSTWESGKFVPDTDHLPALSEELDLSLDALFAEEDSGWELKPVNFDPDHMFTFVKTKARENGLRQSLAVMDLLRKAHGDQKRWSRYGFETSYMVHPLTLACHAFAMGLKNDDVIAVCLAHDMVEDSGITLSALPVGERVREAVGLVSKNLYDHEDPDWEDKYYKAIRRNPLACLVKCLDRVHNLAGLADEYSRKEMVSYTRETDRYYPDLLKEVRKVPEWNDAWWLLRYQLNSLEETLKRLL